MSEKIRQSQASSWWDNSAGSRLELSLSQFEAAAFNFAQRAINDASVRQQYITQTRRLSVEFRTKVASGGMSAEAAANAVNTLRNEILAAQRLQSSDIGRASAINLKQKGLTLSDLVSKYSQKFFQKPFGS